MFLKSSRIQIKSRRKDIINLLKTNKEMHVCDIAESLNISVATARRDLAFLETQGLLKRKHGFASAETNLNGFEWPNKAVPTQLNILPAINKQYITENTHKIAQAAAELIEDGDTVFINSSTTALFIYPFIKNKDVIIVTNNAYAAFVEKEPSVHIILLGGDLNRNREKYMLTGDMVLNSISMITAKKCIIGVSGISVNGGITTGHMVDLPINRKMFSQCSGKRIIVTEPYKIGKQYNFFNFDINEVTDLITAPGADETELEQIRNSGINVIITE